MKRTLRRLSFFSLLIFCTMAAVSGRTNVRAEARASAVSLRQSEGTASEAASPTKELAEEEEKDKNIAFKHSGSVKFLSRVTGLSLEHAYWLAVVLNFTLIAGTIVWFLRKKLPGVFSDRTASIKKAMEEASKASAEANQRLSAIEARLSRLDAEIGEMRTAAEKEAATEEARIVAATEEEKRKIVESVEQEITAVTKSARRELKAYAANLAVNLAEKQVQVDAATDQALVRSFASQLSASGATPRDGN